MLPFYYTLMGFITQEETHDTIFHHVHISPRHIAMAVIVMTTLIGGGAYFASNMLTGSRADFRRENQLIQQAANKPAILNKLTPSAGVSKVNPLGNNSPTNKPEPTKPEPKPTDQWKNVNGYRCETGPNGLCYIFVSGKSVVIPASVLSLQIKAEQAASVANQAGVALNQAQQVYNSANAAYMACKDNTNCSDLQTLGIARDQALKELEQKKLTAARATETARWQALAAQAEKEKKEKEKREQNVNNYEKDCANTAAGCAQ